MIAYRLRHAYAVATGTLALFAAPGSGGAQMPGVVSAGFVDNGPVAGTVSQPERSGFLARQLTYPRVLRAFERKGERMEAVLDARGVEDVAGIFFRVFKREQEMEVWVREPAERRFALVRTYPVCETSGHLGPKRREGDQQIPEGFYSIDVFNPMSEYHLSMRVDYPNAVDRVRGHGGPLGGDIYIHGGCATIGCVPVTDEYIEEIYLLAASARDAGQHQIPVHIFPTRLSDDGLRWLAESYGTDHRDYPFWQNLQEGYLAFDRSRVPPRIGYDDSRYTVLPPATTPLGSPVTEPGLLRRFTPFSLPALGLARPRPLPNPVTRDHPIDLPGLPAADSAAVPSAPPAALPVESSVSDSIAPPAPRPRV